MDCGCYAIHSMRHMVGSEPLECTKADVVTSYRSLGLRDDSQKKEVDGTTTAEYLFPNGVVGAIQCSLNGSLFRDPVLPVLVVRLLCPTC